MSPVVVNAHWKLELSTSDLVMLNTRPGMASSVYDVTDHAPWPRSKNNTFSEHKFTPFVLNIILKKCPYIVSAEWSSNIQQKEKHIFDWRGALSSV